MTSTHHGSIGSDLHTRYCSAGRRRGETGSEGRSSKPYLAWKRIRVLHGQRFGS